VLTVLSKGRLNCDLAVDTQFKAQTGGRASYRGSIHFMNAQGRLAKLAGTVGVFEHDTEADDKPGVETLGMKIILRRLPSAYLKRSYRKCLDSAHSLNTGRPHFR
jgi:hypothetical protein